MSDRRSKRLIEPGLETTHERYGASEVNPAEFSWLLAAREGIAVVLYDENELADRVGQPRAQNGSWGRLRIRCQCHTIVRRRKAGWLAGCTVLTETTDQLTRVCTASHCARLG